MIELTQEEIEEVLARKICPCSPAEILEDILEDMDCTIEDFLANSNITKDELLSISKGEVYITEDIASNIDKLFFDEDDYCVDRSSWRVLQLKYDLWKKHND